MTLSAVLLASTGATFLLQSLLMAIDEFIYHHRRGLGRFERWGHAADTLLFLAALIIPALTAPNSATLTTYVIAGVLSAAAITKDEPVHATSCSAAEHWLHALLFVVHPLVLVSYGGLWWVGAYPAVHAVVPALVFLWGVYQWAYWIVYQEWLAHHRQVTRRGAAQPK